MATGGLSLRMTSMATNVECVAIYFDQNRNGINMRPTNRKIRFVVTWESSEPSYWSILLIHAYKNLIPYMFVINSSQMISHGLIWRLQSQFRCQINFKMWPLVCIPFEGMKERYTYNMWYFLLSLGTDESVEFGRQPGQVQDPNCASFTRNLQNMPTIHEGKPEDINM